MVYPGVAGSTAKEASDTFWKPSRREKEAKPSVARKKGVVRDYPQPSGYLPGSPILPLAVALNPYNN